MQNFGEIKNHFNSLLSEGITKKDGEKKKLFKEYVKAIKNDKVLKDQFLVYNNIETKVEENEQKAAEFVKANIDALLSNYTKEQIVEANLKLSQPIMFDQDGYTNELAQLHEDIATLIFTENNARNVDIRVEALNGIVDYIKENVVREEGEATILPNSAVANIAVEKFNDKYADLSENQKRVLKTIIESDENGKEEMFKNFTKECIDLVNESLKDSDVETKEKLLEVKDKILRMEYNSESFITDISRLIELNEDLSE